jgi:transglycosylase-like protein with SLT domain
VAHGQIELRAEPRGGEAAPRPSAVESSDGSASRGLEGSADAEAQEGSPRREEPGGVSSSGAVASSGDAQPSVAVSAGGEVAGSAEVEPSRELEASRGAAAARAGASGGAVAAANAGEAPQAAVATGADDLTPKGAPEVRVRDVTTKPGLAASTELGASRPPAAAPAAGDVTPKGLPEVRIRDVATKPGFGASTAGSPGELESSGPRLATPPPPPEVWARDAGASLAGGGRGAVESRSAVEWPRPRLATPPPLPPELMRGDAAAGRGGEPRGEPASLGHGIGALRDEPFVAPARRSARSWWGASLVVLCVGGVLIWALRETQRDRTVAPVAATGPAPSLGASGTPAAPPTLGRQAIDTLAAAAHGYGGIESPELAELLDEEAETLARGGGACAPGAAGCELVSTAHGLSTAPGAGSTGERQGERGSWLDGLEVPGIGIKDDARVRRFFEFHTRNSVGREAFQELLFRCAPYRDTVEAALARYGVAPQLLAVAMATSGCVADAESAEAGRGLWQLTPAAAKAYHLRVKDQVLDERLEPVKSTEAGVRLLEDLYRKTGSWELAISAFRVGPLPLLARLSGVGDGADYWALVDSGGLSGDAAAIVPKVQAFALILANLDKFRFEPVPLRAAEPTALLEVPPGTRLGLVARAAGSSTTKIRELNPDMMGDRVPDWPGEKFSLRVPKDASERAREAMPELITSPDHADECVPHAFDWGRQRFTTAMASRCEHASAMNH